MKNIKALLLIAATVALAACGDKDAEDSAAADNACNACAE
jgi:hypothetical protein